MSRSLHAFVLATIFAGASAGCSRFGALYPPRPPSTGGAPVADPTPSRVVAHLSVTSGALLAALEQSIPKTGEGTFPLLGTERRYRWEREPLALAFAQGRLVLDTRVRTTVTMPTGVPNVEFPLDIHVLTEPVVNTEYAVKLQSTEVKTASSDRRLRVADHVGGVFDVIAQQLGARLKEFSYDLKPLLGEAYARLDKPLELPLGDAKGCADLKVLGIEAGPTVVADGIEKDLALIVAPSVTMPCARGNAPGPIPRLSNVATLIPGPFTVTVPIAARYDELTRAMALAFTDGKLFFSTDYPKLYLEKPEIYESQGQVVLKLHLIGPVHKFGIDADLDGEIFLSGHPSVVDNEIRVPDLEPTIETSNFLLSLKAMADGQKIRDQARAALRLDIGERLASVRSKLSSDLTFGTPQACFKGDVDKVEVTGVHAHASYLRVYVAVTGRAAASMPCPAGTLPQPSASAAP